MKRYSASLHAVLLLLCLVTVLTPIRLAVAADAMLYVDPARLENENLAVGDSFRIAVKLDNLLISDNLAGVEFTLFWDPTLLQAADVTEVMFHEVTPASEWDNIWTIKLTIDNTRGSAMYACTFFDLRRAQAGGYLPISGNNTVMTIEFEVKNKGECALHFEIVKLGDIIPSPISCVAIDGFFRNAPPVFVPNLPPPQVNDTWGSGKVFFYDVTLGSVVDNSGIVGAYFKIAWDPALLEAVNMTEVMFHEVTPETEWDNIWEVKHEIDNTNGYAVYGYTFSDVNRATAGSYAPIFGNHTLATVAFRVKGYGECEISLAELKVAGTEASPIICATVQSYFSNVIRGDLDENHAVEIYDALLVANAFGSSRGNANWRQAADLDGNDIVDIFDLIKLARNFGRKA
jgi:hypothetical protein